MSSAALPASPVAISRYTQAMAKCLDQLPGSGMPERATVHMLVNLVQGRMLEYIADRICREYEIQDEQSRFQMITALLGIFSDEFFALFRSKIEFKPALAINIARRIIRKESHPTPLTSQSAIRQPADRIFPAIFRKYFEYRNLGTLLEMVESDVEIQKILLLSQVRQAGRESPGVRRLAEILAEDHEGFGTTYFMDYLKRHHTAGLLQLVESGDWEQGVQAVRQRMVSLRGD
jgi:hypothetical protein